MKTVEPAIESMQNRQYTKLYSDFLSGTTPITRYFSLGNAAEVANRIGPPKVDREILCDILLKQNQKFGAKPKALGAIEGLRQMDALCIFSGQQAGLFGGPLLTLYKAIDIVKRAHILEKQLSRPVIPIFWIAADDHDFAEINHTYYVNPEGDLVRIGYNHPDDNQVPIAEICLESQEEYSALKEQAEKAFGGTDFSNELLKRLFTAYTPEKCMAGAFAEYMTDIMPDCGLVFFCPTDKDIKFHSRDFFKRLTESHFRLKQLLEETNNFLVEDGYHIQVEKKSSAVHLFFHDPDRTAVHFLDDSFHVGKKRLGLPGILDLIDRNPEKFSPDVLTRPLWQSYLFPVVAQVGGPSEIAYFGQIGKLFRLFDMAAPRYYPRTSATIVDKKSEELFEKYNFGMDDLTGDIEQLINRVAAESFPKDIEEKIKSFRRLLDDEYSRFEKDMITYDETLEPNSKQAYGKIDFALNNFEKKIFGRHKQKMQSVRNQIYKISEILYPDKNLQERSLNINYFIAKYGFNLVGFIARNLDIGTTENQIIPLSKFVE